MGSNLILRRGNASEILQELMNETGALGVYWSRAYDPESIYRDTKVKSSLNGISFKGHVLFEPWVPKTKTGENFKVYTPFWRHVSSQLCVNSTLPKISKLYSPVDWPISDGLSDWKLGEEMNRGKNVVSKYINVGEEAALNKLDHFISLNIDGYKVGRDFPMRNATSGLSENLTYGEISPRLVFNSLRNAFDSGDLGAEHFLKELVWREFAYHLLWHFPKLDNK